MSRKIGIYKIVNTVNGKTYIGQSLNIEERWYRHKKDYKKIDYPLYRAMRKYGFENFKFEIVEECVKEELNKKELFHIKNHSCMCPDGYNQVMMGHTSVNMNFLKMEDIKKDIKNNKKSMDEIHLEHNVSLQTISAINSGRTWYDENEDYPLRKRERKISHCPFCSKEMSAVGVKMCIDCRKEKDKVDISEKELSDLIKFFNFSEIARKFDTSPTTIRKKCKQFKLIS